jgi:hypothetical protein
MKHILITIAAISFTGCGMSEDEKNKIINDAAEMRAKQVCEGDGSLDNYGEKLNWLGEQLREEGIDSEGFNKATELFDEKIKSNCPEKRPK